MQQPHHRFWAAALDSLYLRPPKHAAPALAPDLIELTLVDERRYLSVLPNACPIFGN